MEVIPLTLEDMGYTLFGEDWRSVFAEELGVTEETVRSWETDQAARPADLQDKVEQFGRLQIEMIEIMLAQLKEAGLRAPESEIPGDK